MIAVISFGLKIMRAKLAFVQAPAHACFATTASLLVLLADMVNFLEATGSVLVSQKVLFAKIDGSLCAEVILSGLSNSIRLFAAAFERIPTCRLFFQFEIYSNVFSGPFSDRDRSKTTQRPLKECPETAQRLLKDHS